MIDELDVVLKTRARVQALTVMSVTGSFSATADGYARTTGSFLTDGFEIGQEITPSGFSAAVNNNVKVIIDVQALSLKTAGYGVDGSGKRVLSGSGTAVEAAGTRTLAVKMPITIEVEGLKITPAQGIPWWREEFSPSPGGSVRGIGSGTDLVVNIDYFATLFVPTAMGPRAARKYGKALKDAFPPSQPITLADALSTCRVRSDVVPWVGQLFEAPKPYEGFLVVPVVVPLYTWSPNSI